LTDGHALLRRRSGCAAGQHVVTTVNEADMRVIPDADIRAATCAGNMAGARGEVNTHSGGAWKGGAGPLP
jgi:hypothetical protein